MIDLLSYIPQKRKHTSSGWISFNAPCCVHQGESQDKRLRGGIKQQEDDLVNKRFERNLIQRQQNILTRLLESEKALMERGLDEKRESKSGKNQNLGNQIRFEEYNKEKLKQIELLRSVDPAYKKYYKDRANEYFNRAL